MELLHLVKDQVMDTSKVESIRPRYLAESRHYRYSIYQYVAKLLLHY